MTPRSRGAPARGMLGRDGRGGGWPIDNPVPRGSGRLIARCACRGARRTWRSGSVVLLVVGFLTVIVLLVFALQRRVGEQQSMITMVDESQVARNVLEGAADDLLLFCRVHANQKGHPLHAALRNLTPGGTAVDLDPGAVGYRRSDLLEVLVAAHAGDERYAVVIAPPRMRVKAMTPLPLPPMLAYADPTRVGQEWQGDLEIVTRVQMRARSYELTVSHRLRMVFVMLPMLREFAWFFDRLDEEQTGGTAGDQINVVEVAGGKVRGPAYPLTLGLLAADPGQPEYQDPMRTGRVFIGAEGRPVFLNLAGELDPVQSEASGLWQVRKPHFDLPGAAGGAGPGAIGGGGAGGVDGGSVDPLGRIEFGRFGAVGGDFKVRHLRVGLRREDPNDGNVCSMMYLMGYGDELAGIGGRSIFAGSAYSLDDFIGDDPAWRDTYGRDPRRLRFASVLNPLGPNLLGADAGAMPLPQRFIYGDAFRRFFVFAFFRFPSVAPTVLPWSADPNHFANLSLKTVGGSPVSVDMPAGLTYQQVMSNVVSGAPGGGPGAYPANYQTCNRTSPGGARASNQPLTFQDFQGADGLQATRPFGCYREQFLAGPVGGGGPAHTLSGRVGRVFPSGRDFLAAATGDPEGLGASGGRAAGCAAGGGTGAGGNGALSPVVGDGTWPTPGAGRFWVQGVVAVRGDLDLSAGISTTEVRGGVVIVDGSLTLGPVTRGRPVPGADAAGLQTFIAAIRDLEPAEILTFVVVKPGATVTLRGHCWYGVQVVSLAEGGETPLTIEPTDGPGCFVGGLAFSRPGLAAVARRLSADSSFFYPPAMATDAPPRAADLDPARSAYRLEVQ